MLEKLTETLAKLQDNPMDTLKWLVEEEKKLKNTILSNRPSTLLLIKYLEEKYKKEDLSAISENLQSFIEERMKPSLTDRLLSDIQDPLDEIQKTFWSWESEIETLINEYADLFHKQPCDQKEVDTRLETHGIWTTKVIQLPASKDSPSNNDAEITTVEEKTDVLDPENISEQPQLEKVIELAKSEIGTNEKDDSADKYFRELWYKHDSKDVPWCGAFVSWTLMKAGFPLPKNDLSAKSFINDEGLWHVWIKVADKIISWNYWNKVSTDTIDKINKKIVWYAIPTSSGLQIHKENIKFEKIPEGAVVVFDRKKTRIQAA